MARVPCKVFVENSSTNRPELQHPRLPRRRVFGQLQAEAAGLVLQPILYNHFANNGGSQPHPQHQPIIFPWQHIKNCTGGVDGMVGPGATTLALMFPLPLLMDIMTLGVASTKRGYVLLEFWDEEWELDGIAVFSLFNIPFNRRGVAEDTAQEILSHRRNYMQQLRQAVTPRSG